MNCKIFTKIPYSTKGSCNLGINILFIFTFQMDLKPQSVPNFWVTGCNRVQIKVIISVFGWNCPSPALFPWLLCCFKKWKIQFYNHKQGFFFCWQSQHFPSITLANVKTYAPAVSWTLSLIIMKGSVRYCIPTVTNVGTMNTKWNSHGKQKDYKFKNFSHARKLKLKMTP